ncbi:MAG: hypothetical protein N3C12_04530 [Candidatus Binatia bacterium]|nr:hypothetical protein [Candidatus Binatia bacterium]
MGSEARARIPILAEELKQAVGEDFVSLLLYGSAAAGDYIEGISDLNFLVVVRGSPIAVLEKLRPHWPRWQKRGMAVPLVVQEDFFRRAADVFPMELLDMRECHEVLGGEDPLHSVDIDPAHLRHQLEFELRSKWLKLGSLYLQSADLGAHGSDATLLEAAKSFAILMRHMLRLAGQELPHRYVEVAERFEATFGVMLPATRTLLGIRQRQLHWAKQRERLFRGFLEEMGRVVHVADGLLLEGARQT